MTKKKELFTVRKQLDEIVNEGTVCSDGMGILKE